MRSMERERVALGLKEAIRFLCKTGLTYNTELTVEGLLGITLDKNEVFLVNIREIMKGMDKTENHELTNGENDSPLQTSNWQPSELKCDEESVETIKTNKTEIIQPPSILATVTYEDEVDSESELVVDMKEENTSDISSQNGYTENKDNKSSMPLGSAALKQIAENHLASGTQSLLSSVLLEGPNNVRTTRSPSETSNIDQTEVTNSTQWLPGKSTGSESGQHTPTSSRVSTPLSGPTRGSTPDVPLNLSGSSSRRKTSVPEKRKNIDQEVFDVSENSSDVIVIKPEPHELQDSRSVSPDHSDVNMEEDTPRSSGFRSHFPVPLLSFPNALFSPPSTALEAYQVRIIYCFHNNILHN